MKRVLVDSDNNIIYEGIDAKEVLRILNAEPEDITENDEIKYAKELTLSWIGGIKYEIHVNLKFVGIDDWNRPVFKDIDDDFYFGDVNRLWVFRELGENNETILNYYRDNIGALEFFGRRFNCEPHGGLASHVKLNII
jgi:hypothetical protein